MKVTARGSTNHKPRRSLQAFIAASMRASAPSGSGAALELMITHYLGHPIAWRFKLLSVKISLLKRRLVTRPRIWSVLIPLLSGLPFRTPVEGCRVGCEIVLTGVSSDPFRAGNFHFFTYEECLMCPLKKFWDRRISDYWTHFRVLASIACSLRPRTVLHAAYVTCQASCSFSWKSKLFIRQHEHHDQDLYM